MQGDFCVNDEKTLIVYSPKSPIATKRKGILVEGPLMKRSMLLD
jgi:hypothetical protein